MFIRVFGYSEYLIKSVNIINKCVIILIMLMMINIVNSVVLRMRILEFE